MSTILQWTRTDWVIVGVVVVQAAASSSSPSSSPPPNDPYRTLGVSPRSSDSEIKKAYRKLALQYHPDKHAQSSPVQRRQMESRFKQVQEAYDRIGTAEARDEHRYFRGNSNNMGGGDGRARNFTGRSFASGTARSPYGNDPVAEAFFRAFEKGNFGPRGSSSRNGFRRSFSGFAGRSSMSSSSPHSSPMMPAGLSFKSVYVQKVQVPLEHLYRGVKLFRFDLEENLWTRYRAAWRGKILFLSFYQGLLYGIPVLRTGSKFFAACVGLFLMHATLPRPDPNRIYETALRKGLKGGSSIKFASTAFGQPEVVFELEEEPHPYYSRVDNDLHVTLYITSVEAEHGCTKQIHALDPAEPPIDVRVPPNVYHYEKKGRRNADNNNNNNNSGIKSQDSSSSSKAIRIPGRGWPIRHHEPEVYLYGDVVVTVKVRKPSSDPSSKRKRRKKQ